jgi:HTH-type transcriptional regulator / antitoxin HipB
MSDLKKYIANRKHRDADFAKGYDKGYTEFKVGVLIRQAREQVGLTQEELAKRLHTKKTAISRLEKHATDIRLSTLLKLAKVLGKELQVVLR